MRPRNSRSLAPTLSAPSQFILLTLRVVANWLACSSKETDVETTLTMRPRDTTKVCDIFVTVATMLTLVSSTAEMVIEKASSASAEQEPLRLITPPMLKDMISFPRLVNSWPYSALTSNVKNLKTDEKTRSQLWPSWLIVKPPISICCRICMTPKLMVSVSCKILSSCSRRASKADGS